MNELMTILSPVLGDKLARAIIDHRIAKKAKLTPYAAELQVREYLKTGDPVAAAEMQILHNWVAIKSRWFFDEVAKEQRQQPRFCSPPKPMSQHHQFQQDTYRKLQDHAYGGHDEFTGAIIDVATEYSRSH